MTSSERRAAMARDVLRQRAMRGLAEGGADALRGRNGTDRASRTLERDAVSLDGLLGADSAPAVPQGAPVVPSEAPPLRPIGWEFTTAGGLRQQAMDEVEALRRAWAAQVMTRDGGQR
jgi:hypothetical protein